MDPESSKNRTGTVQTQALVMISADEQNTTDADVLY